MIGAAAIGAALGLGIFALARWLAMDNDRSFYPTVLTIIASYYVLFAVIAGDTTAAAIELAIAVPFLACSLLGLQNGTRIVAIGIAMHGGYDLVHCYLELDHGAPGWWPAFCGAIDVALGLALIIGQRRKLPQS